jgi:hypothetical protein
VKFEEVNGAPAALVLVNGSPISVMLFESTPAGITSISSVVNPEKLRTITQQLKKLVSGLEN